TRAKHFERIDTASPNPRDTQEQAKNQSAASTLGDQTLRMKVRNAIDEPLSEQEVEWCDEMHHQRRTAGKEHGIRPPHGCECCAEQHQVRDYRPDQPCQEFLFLVGAAMAAKHLERAIADWFRGLSVRLPAGQSD